MDFARTQLGHRFFEHTLPSLVRETGRLADALGRLAGTTARLAVSLEPLAEATARLAVALERLAEQHATPPSGEP